MFFIGVEIAKGLASLRTPYATLLTNNQNRFMQKEKRKIQITAAKVRGFLADSKKLAWFLSKLLRQDIGFATK